jgi:hypothetical protein
MPAKNSSWSLIGELMNPFRCFIAIFKNRGALQYGNLSFLVAPTDMLFNKFTVTAIESSVTEGWLHKQISAYSTS